jgi:hypothetical protein
VRAYGSASPSWPLTPAGITRITVFGGGPDLLTTFGLPAVV